MSGGKRRVLKKSCLIFKSPSEGYERARLVSDLLLLLFACRFVFFMNWTQVRGRSPVIILYKSL